MRFGGLTGLDPWPLPPRAGVVMMIVSEAMNDAGESKQRHGCLTAYLVTAIIFNALTALIYLFAAGTVKRGFPNSPAWTLPVLVMAGILNVVCACALFQWKKWGFFGLVATSILATCVNLMIGVNIFQAIFGLLGLGILYAALQIGKETNGWTQLE
jgi:hypothetical protein